MLNLFAEFIQNPSNKANDNTKEKFATTSVVNPLQCKHVQNPIVVNPFFNTVIFLMMFSFCKGANIKTRCKANDTSASKPAAIDAIFGVLNCPTPGKL